MNRASIILPSSDRNEAKLDEYKKRVSARRIKFEIEKRIIFV